MAHGIGGHSIMKTKYKLLQNITFFANTLANAQNKCYNHINTNSAN